MKRKYISPKFLLKELNYKYDIANISLISFIDTDNAVETGPDWEYCPDDQ